MKNTIVLIDNGHGENTPGKCSPDRRLLEWKYTREIAQDVERELRKKGVDARRIVTEDKDVSLPQRCERVNQYCYRHGKGNVILVSIHVNAAGKDGRWLTAGGWCAYTCKGETKSDELAECLYDAADNHLAEYRDLMIRGKAEGYYDSKQRPIRMDRTDGDRDIEANFTILYNTLCPAVLTENLFQDNPWDVEYLFSDKGKQAIVGLHVDGILQYLNQ